MKIGFLRKLLFYLPLYEELVEYLRVALEVFSLGLGCPCVLFVVSKELQVLVIEVLLIQLC